MSDTRLDLEDDCNELLAEVNRWKAVYNDITAAFEPIAHLYCHMGAPVVPTLAQMVAEAVVDMIAVKERLDDLFIEHAHDGDLHEEGEYERDS